MRSCSASNPLLVVLNAQFAEISELQTALREPTVKRQCVLSL
jgi:hypothetical protein